MAGVEDPDLLVHDATATVPGAHINGVDEYSCGKLIAKPFGLAFLFRFGKAWALEDADSYAAGGGIAQSAVELLACAGAHPAEILFVEALLIVALGIGQEG